MSGTGLSRTFAGLSASTEYTVTVTASNPDGGAGTAREGTQTTSAAVSETDVNTKVAATQNLGTTTVQGAVLDTQTATRSVKDVINTYLVNDLTDAEVDFVVANLDTKYKFEIEVGERRRGFIARFEIVTNWDGTGNNAQTADLTLTPEILPGNFPYEHKITFNEQTKTIKMTDSYGGGPNQVGSIRYFKVLRVTTP